MESQARQFSSANGADNAGFQPDDLSDSYNSSGEVNAKNATALNNVDQSFNGPAASGAELRSDNAVTGQLSVHFV